MRIERISADCLANFCVRKPRRGVALLRELRHRGRLPSNAHLSQAVRRLLSETADVLYLREDALDDTVISAISVASMSALGGITALSPAATA